MGWFRVHRTGRARMDESSCQVRLRVPDRQAFPGTSAEPRILLLRHASDALCIVNVVVGPPSGPSSRSSKPFQAVGLYETYPPFATRLRWASPGSRGKPKTRAVRARSQPRDSCRGASVVLHDRQDARWRGLDPQNRCALRIRKRKRPRGSSMLAAGPPRSVRSGGAQLSAVASTGSSVDGSGAPWLKDRPSACSISPSTLTWMVAVASSPRRSTSSASGSSM